jgi:endonuclease I
LKKSFFPLLGAFVFSSQVANASPCIQVKHEVTQKVVEICDDNFTGNKNTFSNSFSKAKRNLKKQVYNDTVLPRNTFYCGCDYSDKKVVDNKKCGFQHNNKYVSRSKKIEWEHVVPAEAFGKSFIEWRE